jgi:prepilin-type N-terminal cleavage/methylation domain-containing protein
MNPRPHRLYDRSSRGGFTLVEIALVIIIIGLVATLAMPAIMASRENARGARFINDLRQGRAAFEIFALENGNYPDDDFPGSIPAGMEGYLRYVKWTEETAIGGQWDWDYDAWGCLAGISVYGPTVSEKLLRRIDERIDDGDLETGGFHSRDNGYIYVIE